MEDRELLADNAWVTAAGGACSASRSRSSSASAFAVALHLSDALRRAFYPLLVASQTVPVIVDRADPRRLVRLRDRAEAGDHRARSASSRSPSTRSTACARSTREQPRMMRTLDAGRAQILRRLELPSALPVPVQRRQDRRRGRGDRRRLRRVVGLRRGPRPPDPGRPGPAPDRARVRGGRRALGDGDRAVRAARAARAALRLVGATASRCSDRGRDAGPRSRVALACARARRRLRREARSRAPAARPQPFDLALDFYVNPDHAGHLHGARARLLRARPGSTSSRGCPPTRRRRSSRSPPGASTSRSPTSPRCCWRATRGCRCRRRGARRTAR